MPESRRDRSTRAVLAASRMLRAPAGAADAAGLHRVIAEEARDLFGADGAALLALVPESEDARIAAADPEGPERAAAGPLPVAALHDLLAGQEPLVRASAADSAVLARALGWAPSPEPMLLLAARTHERVDDVVVLQPAPGQVLEPEDLELAVAFTAGAAAILAQLRLADEQARRGAEQAALLRAAQTLNASLDLTDTLDAIAREARAILDGDIAVVFRGDAARGLTLEHAIGVPPEHLGLRLQAGDGLCGLVARSGRPQRTNHYQRDIAPDPDGPFARLRSCLAVPMHWDDALHGVVAVGFERERRVEPHDVALLETFAQLAAVACRNATTVTSLTLAARTDGLTGCLNHAALQDGLRREIGRAERTDRPVSVVLLDLDDFKAVNESQGHLVGDEVLRRVGHALRTATRPYDLVARYGGDEFAIVATDADEACAQDIAGRALARIGETLDDLGWISGTRATAGVAELEPGQGAGALLEQADRALLFAKQEGARGTALCASALPDRFRPGRFRRPETAPRRAPTPAEHVVPSDAHWPTDPADADRLQHRARRLAFASRLGASVAGLTDARRIAGTVVRELRETVGATSCAVVHRRADDVLETVCAERDAAAGPALAEPASDGGALERCLRERRVIVAPGPVSPEPSAPRTVLCAPILAGEQLWGAISLELPIEGTAAEDEAPLLGAVADATGSALLAARRYEQLEGAYLGTAEALTGALQEAGPHGAEHRRAFVDRAAAVGRRLGLRDDELRDLRFAAAFHDLGKLAVPEAILRKPGPLDAEEWRIVRERTAAGERMLAPVGFLHRARAILRHEHEHWDGTGYPDGCAGEEIPLGARIVLVCAAHDAMTSDRPYRAALDEHAARAELRAGAGTQFDPAVVDAFLAVLDETPVAGPPAAA